MLAEPLENTMALTNDKSEGRRDRIRLQYLAAAKLTKVNGSVVHGNLRDIGIDSLFIKIDGGQSTKLSIEEAVEVTITVTQGQSCLTINTPGKVLRLDEDGVAVTFTEPLKWWPVFSLFPVNEQFLFDVVTKAL